MKPAQAVCNYALLQFLPYPDTGEFANVGVLVTCESPCLLQFEATEQMTERLKAMFPQHDEQTFRAAITSMRKDMDRAKASIRDPKLLTRVFNELTRRRESLLRFGEVRTILTDAPESLPADLYRRYVRMERPQTSASNRVAA